MNVTGGFASATTSDSTVAWTVQGLRNPRSTAPTLSFKAYINDASDNGQYIVESGERLTISTSSDFVDIAYTRDSTVNGITTIYYFTITLNNQIISGDFIRIIFPAEVTLKSTTNQCAGITNLQSSLTCSLNSQTIDTSISLLSGVTKLPTTIGDTTTTIKFSISNVQNPLSLATTTTSIQAFMLKSSKNYRINRRTTGMTITNTASGSISNATASPDDSSLGVTTNYLISFKPDNTILQGTVVKVTIPSELEVSTATAMA